VNGGAMVMFFFVLCDVVMPVTGVIGGAMMAMVNGM
jgi:hypothetical protein